MSDEMREAFDLFYDKHFWKKSIKRNLIDKITGRPYFYPEKDDTWIIWQAATAAADAKYLPVIEKLVTAVKAADAVGTYRGHMGEMAQATMAEALTAAAPYRKLMGGV